MTRLFQSPPGALLRLAMRLPVWLYRLRLGRLLGHRFLLLTHRGRKSGRVHQTMLEVVHYDPATRESVVAAAWGVRADWYRNITASPPIAVETGGHRYKSPGFRVLAPEENYPIVVDYVRRLPAGGLELARTLPRDW